MLVPWDGGELFVTIKPKEMEGDPNDKKKSYFIIHADLNAAQNLQRRFWGRRADAYRIKAKLVNGVWNVDASGSRLPGALALTLGLNPINPPLFFLEGNTIGAVLKTYAGKTQLKRQN